MIKPWMLWAGSAGLLFIIGFGYGHHIASVEAKADAQDLKVSQLTDANSAWAERFTLQAQLATRDQQLAEAQQLASEARTETIIKREVIYRERTKDPVVRDCVANSGLLDLYDATLGLPDPTK